MNEKRICELQKALETAEPSQVGDLLSELYRLLRRG